MQTPAPPSLLQHLWKSALVSGVLVTGLGIAVVAWPGISVLVAAIFFGAYLLVTGITQVVFAFSLHVSAGGRVLLFISGAASVVLGVLAFRQLGSAVLLLAIWVGIGFIFRGVATAVSAISDPTLPGRGWNIFLGVITLIAGIVVLASPFESIGTLALVTGIWLIVIGFMEIITAFGIHSASKGSATAVEPAAPAPVATSAAAPATTPAATTPTATETGQEPPASEPASTS